MKLIKIITNVVILVFSFLIFSCSNDEKVENIGEKKNIELLKTDDRFVNLLNSNIKLIKNVKNVKRVNEILEKDNLSDSELNELAKCLGFSDITSYRQYIIDEKKVLSELNSEYEMSLNEIPQEKLDELAIQTSALQTRSVNNYCEMKRINCLEKAAITALIEHTFCLLTDSTLVVGVICHAGVTSMQVLENEGCNIDAGECNRQREIEMHNNYDYFDKRKGY